MEAFVVAEVHLKDLVTFRLDANGEDFLEFAFGLTLEAIFGVDRINHGNTRRVAETHEKAQLRQVFLILFLRWRLLNSWQIFWLYRDLYFGGLCFICWRFSLFLLLDLECVTLKRSLPLEFLEDLIYEIYHADCNSFECVRSLAHLLQFLRLHKLFYKFGLSECGQHGVTQSWDIILDLLVKIDKFVRNLQTLHLLLDKVSNVDFFAHRVIYRLQFSRIFENLNELIVRNLLNLFLDVLFESFVQGGNHCSHGRFVDFALFH